jgi:hypothetical protein
MQSQILNSGHQQSGVFVEVTDADIAKVAKQPAHSATNVVMVKMKRLVAAVSSERRLFADRALTVLIGHKFVPDVDRNAVGVLEASGLTTPLRSGIHFVQGLSLLFAVVGAVTPFVMDSVSTLHARSRISPSAVDALQEFIHRARRLTFRAYAPVFKQLWNLFAVVLPVGLKVVKSDFFLAKGTGCEDVPSAVGGVDYGRFGHSVICFLISPVLNSLWHQPQGINFGGLPPACFAGIFFDMNVVYDKN